MLNLAHKDCLKENIQELQNFIAHTRDVREWKRGEAVKLRILGHSYWEIKERLGVSTSFIAQTQKKFLVQGINGLKLRYQGSKSYLKATAKREIFEWLRLPKNRNISEIERHLIETYDVVFKSQQSYYQILNEAQLTWQKANQANPKKNRNNYTKRSRNS